jgi:hypothetical protein
MQNDWHLDRVVAAIRSAAQDPEKPAIADALATAIAKQEGRERVAARKRQWAGAESRASAGGGGRDIRSMG